MARFAVTFCSQCGGEFGPGDHGFSHCRDHIGAPSMTLQQWDREVAPFLHVIERTGREVASLTEQMGQAVLLLQARPDWPTKAGDELELAEREAIATLDRIRAARARYAALPATE
jgi:hypothetical protein